jgi:CRISPR/Cas system CMR-associated protein Cmr1 (group 7 of RAMP superfamily)
MQIDYALISFENIGIKWRKGRGHLPLKHIEPRFTEDYIMMLQHPF